MQDCSHLKADWNKFEEMFKVFDSPTYFVYHVGKDLIINHHEIFSEIKDSITHNIEQWKAFGIDVGKAAVKALLGEVPSTPKAIKVAEITQGLIQSYGGYFDLESLLVCIHDEDEALWSLTMHSKNLKMPINRKAFKTQSEASLLQSPESNRSNKASQPAKQSTLLHGTGITSIPHLTSCTIQLTNLKHLKMN